MADSRALMALVGLTACLLVADGTQAQTLTPSGAFVQVGTTGHTHEVSVGLTWDWSKEWSAGLAASRAVAPGTFDHHGHLESMQVKISQGSAGASSLPPALQLLEAERRVTHAFGDLGKAQRLRDEVSDPLRWLTRRSEHRPGCELLTAA
jgi:hypothetical protein